MRKSIRLVDFKVDEFLEELDYIDSDKKVKINGSEDVTIQILEDCINIVSN